MPTVEKKTVGLSPKAPAAAAAGLIAPLVARLLADAFGIEVDSETVEGLVLAGIAAVSAFLAAYAAPPGATTTVTEGTSLRASERGYGLVELLIGAILLIVFVWLVFAVVD